MSVYFYLIILCCFAEAIWLSCAAPAAHTWIRTETLRREDGQLTYNYSDSISSLGQLLAIGTSSANRGRGEVNILRDNGGGLRRIATITNPLTNIIGDKFGQSILLFNYNGFKQVAIAALEASSGTGCVYLYQQRVDNETLWDYIQTLTPPTGTYVINFGRRMIYDGSQLLVSAERVYKSGRRFVVTSINIIGTSKYIQSDGVEATIGGDPLLVFRSVEDRDNKTYLEYFDVISDADYSLDAGRSLAVSGDTMVVGASSREQLKYGSGTDGDLDISDNKYLDGAATYNFDNIIIRNGGVLTVDHYDDVRNLGGVMTVKIRGLLYIEKGGLINLTAAGYKGGRTAFTATPPEDGQFIGGGKAASSENVGLYACDYSDTVSVGVSLGASSVGRLAINQSLPFAEACGGGGGFGTQGGKGTKVGCGTSGLGGGTYGDPTLAVLYRGSGGGSGFPWKVGAGGAGGDGGGVVHISAKRIINYGSIDANGGPGSDGGFFSGAGGGGSGGSILLVGDNLANYGTILAKGGRGGERASGSGSGGDALVRGGDGGYGRIKFDFLQTQAHGIVLPRPVNVTTYLGDVLIYKRNATTLRWALKTYLPRLPEFQFIGHSVALSGHILAVASTQGTPVTPLEQVFLIDITSIENDTSPITSYSVINDPNPTYDRLFGYEMGMDNNTLVITAKGTYETRGVTYVFHSRNFILDHSSMVTMYSRHPVPGDSFGNAIALDFPKLYIQLPLSQDETLITSNQRSVGCVVLYKHIRNISTAHSYVTCDYDVITANVTLNCTLHTFASDNYVAGDLVDLLYVTPTVDFRSVGVYTFQVRPMAAGTFLVNTTYKGIALPSVAITVTDMVVASQSTINCTSTSFVAGTPVVCNLYTGPAGTGEDIAKKEFDVVVWNLDDPLASLNGYVDISSMGQNYRSPPSQFVVTQPNVSDYRTMLPVVTFVSQGVYQVNFTTWRAGTYGVIALYQNIALAFPNPVVIDVTIPSVLVSGSYVQCPAVALPNRTLVCILHLISDTGIPADIIGFETQLPWANVTEAGYNSTFTSYEVSAINSDEGRYSILVLPDLIGTFFVNITIDGEQVPMIPSIGINVTTVYPVKCRAYPRLFNSFTLFSQATQARADETLYGVSATNAAYSNGVGFCDDPKV